jgi:acetyltransferase
MNEIDNKEKVVTTFETKTGHRIRVRPMRPDDAPYLVNIFENMSSESRYRRFHQTVDNASPERIWLEAEQIATIDPATSRGLIAFADLPGEPNAPIGAARYVGLGDGSAEAAMSVRDDMQNMGIGTRLLKMLAEEAAVAGVQKFVASIQNSNEAIWRILQRLPFKVQRFPAGSSSEIEVDLTTPLVKFEDSELG